MATRRFSLPLRHKLIAALLLIFALFGGVLAAYFRIVLEPKMVRDQEDVLASKLSNIAQEINSFSREYQNLGVSLARKGEFLHSFVNSAKGATRSLSDEEQKFIEKFLAKEVESFPSIVGAGLFYEPFAFDSQQQLSGFYGHWVPPLGMTRKVEISQERSSAQANYLNTSWYRSLIPSGWNRSRHLYADVTWTDPYREAVTLVPMVSVLVAMYAEDSSLLGLSAVDWNLDELTQVIDRSRPSKNSIAALFSPNTKKFAAVAGLQGLNLEPIERARWMPQLLFNAPPDRFEMVASKDQDGVPFRVYSRTLENGLIYSLVIPESEIFAEVQAIHQQEALLLAAALLAALLLIVLLTRYYLFPLTPLSEVAEQYATGDFKQGFKIRASGELQIIADSFREYRNYADRLQTQLGSLAEGHTASVLETPGQPGQTSANLVMLATTIDTFLTDIEALSEKISRGETASRLDPNKFDGTWRVAAKSCNQILAAFDSLLAESLKLFKAAQDGNSGLRLQNARQGTFETFRSACNGMLDKFKLLNREANREIEATTVAHEEALRALHTKNSTLRHVCSHMSAVMKQAFTSLASLNKETLAKQQASMVSSATNACSDAITTLDQLQSYAQIEEGKVELSNNLFNLRSVLFDLKDALRLRTIKRRQELSLIIDDNVPEFVCADSGVLRNILSVIGYQAIMSTAEEGSIIIRVQVEESTVDSHAVKFTISDSGGASYEAKRTDIISSLDSHNLDSGALSVEGGFNILVATRLAELMGGSLIFSPPSGTGSQCHLRVQLLDGSFKHAEHAIDHTPNISDEIKDHNPRVLVVEDDIICQKFIARLLQRQGCTAVVVGDGHEALSALDQEHFDLIFMDITLPVLDGIETTKRIRSAQKNYSNIPIVAVTAHALRLNYDNVTEDGFNSFILKPIETRSLRENLNRFRIFSKEAFEPAIGSGSRITH